MPRLIVIKGADEGKQFDLTDAVYTVGRDSSNQIRLHDTEVSRRHAEFRDEDGEFRLLDVGSANGTFVNNVQVKDMLLKSGDHVRIGQSILVYTTGKKDNRHQDDLSDRINMISRQQDAEFGSAIIKTIGETEGSKILSSPDKVTAPWLKTALANLSIMYESIQAVSHILDIDQLLERIMDLIFKSIAADRGCIMLLNQNNGQFEPKAVRWRDESYAGEKINLSHTIMDYVMREKQGVLVSDAARDERFATGQSIVRFGIREAICAPMKGRHETLGVLYLDTRGNPRDTTHSPKMTEDHLALAIAIGHQAALAIEETRYRTAMIQAERLAAIGQTIAALSHHIKNILQGLKGGGDIVNMGLAEKDDAMIQQGWKIVEKNQAKIYDLVMDMLSYSKEREPMLEDTNINKVVKDVVELMAGRAKELEVKLDMKLDKSLPKVQVDPEGLHRALLNIVGNAIDAVDGRKNPQVIVATMPDTEDGWIRIIVLDNGVGIAPQKVAEIFRPFVSTKGAKGTGLGLAVSRKILREHGGDILVQSQHNKGSKFILRLAIKSPLAQEASKPGAVPPRPPDEEGEDLEL